MESRIKTPKMVGLMADACCHGRSWYRPSVAFSFRVMRKERRWNKENGEPSHLIAGSSPVVYKDTQWWCTKQQPTFELREEKLTSFVAQPKRSPWPLSCTRMREDR